MMLHQQNIMQFLNNSKIKTRPNAGLGLWLMFLLPVALIVSAVTQPIIATTTYKLSSIFSIGTIFSSVLFLYEASNFKRLNIVNVRQITGSAIVAILFRICLHRGLLFSIWSGIVSTILYQQLYLLVLKKLPNCFSVGEAAVCTQSYVLLLYCTSINIFDTALKTATSGVQISTLIIQVGIVGLSTIIIFTHQFGIRSPTKFYATTLFVFIFVILLPLQILLKQNPLLWIIHLFWEDLQANKVALYWSFCSALTIVVINRRIKVAKKASTAVRKIFHILAVAVFIPGLLYNCAFLYLASGVVFGLFFALELMRILNIPPLGHHLQNGLVVFSDEKDLGAIALTPMYLLAGCALPLWIHPAPCDITNSAIFNLLPLLSGLLTIGVGDTAASVVGSKFGKHHWHGSNKTIEGTIACIVSQSLVVFALVYLDILKLLSVMQHFKTVAAILVTSLIEAKTDQVDNLVLPFIMYIILIV